MSQSLSRSRQHPIPRASLAINPKAKSDVRQIGGEVGPNPGQGELPLLFLSRDQVGLCVLLVGGVCEVGAQLTRMELPACQTSR